MLIVWFMGSKSLISNTMTQCPVCKSINVNQWCRKNNFQLHICRNCSHKFANITGIALLNDDPYVFRKLFTHGQMDSDEDYYQHLCLGERKGAHLFNTVSLILKEVGSRIFDSINSKWLDIGCGSGYLLAELNKMGWDVIGVEPGGWGHIAATKKNIKVEKGFLRRDTFNEKFDVISATDVLEHQSDPYELLDLMRFYIKPNGIGVLSLPFADSFQGKFLKSKWTMINPPTHSHFFTKASLEVLLNNVGFKVMKIIQYNSRITQFLDCMPFMCKFFNMLLEQCVGDQVIVIIEPKEDKIGVS